MPMLLCETHAWWTQRSGNSPSEYEDAYRIGESADGIPLRIAVADGATEATFAGRWAALLSEDFVSGQMTRSTLLERAAKLSTVWLEEVESGSLPWYAQAKLARDGSAAALLGVAIDRATGVYQAVVCGDCLLIHLRNGEVAGGEPAVVRTFPYERWDQFGTSPVLIGTQPRSRSNLLGHVLECTGTAMAGDRLLLMSDTIGAWFLQEYALGRSPWRWFESMERPKTGQTLLKVVRDLRDSGRLKDDDVTLVSVRCVDGTG